MWQLEPSRGHWQHLVDIGQLEANTGNIQVSRKEFKFPEFSLARISATILSRDLEQAETPKPIIVERSDSSDELILSKILKIF